MDVVIIKTTIGEEMVAELVSDIHPTSENAITVSRPRIFQWSQDAKGDMTPSLVPWIALDPDNKNVPLNMNYVATMIPASASLTKSYPTAVSGIVLN